MLGLRWRFARCLVFGCGSTGVDVFREERLGDTGVTLGLFGLDFGFASLGFAVLGVEVGFAFGVRSLDIGLFTATGTGAAVFFKLPTRGFFAPLFLTFSSSSLLKSGETLPIPSCFISLVLLCKELAPNEGALFNACLLPFIASSPQQESDRLILWTRGSTAAPELLVVLLDREDEVSVDARLRFGYLGLENREPELRPEPVLAYVDSVMFPPLELRVVELGVEGLRDLDWERVRGRG